MAESPAPSKLLRRLADKGLPTDERVEIADAAAQSTQQPYEAWQVLCRIMLDEKDDMKVRVAAARAARHCGIAGINHLARAMPAAPHVRAAAVESLRDIATRPLPEYFEGRLREDLAALDNELAVLPLANLAWTFGADPRVYEVARRALAGEDSDIRRTGLQQLCSLGETGTAVTLLRESKDTDMRAAAAELLGYYWAGDENVAAALENALNDPAESVRRAARTARRRMRLERSPRPRRAPQRSPRQEVDSRFPWRRLLEEWSRQWLQIEEFVLLQPDDVVKSGWLGASGASENEIQTLEARLGRRIPPSYRAFLATSNGFRGGGPSIARIRPAEEVRPFIEEERDWVQIWTESEDTELSPEEHLASRDSDGVFRTAYLRAAIQVSDVLDSTVYLLSPDVVDEEGEWEAWLFASWLPGARRYRSFWDLLQAEHASFLQVMQPLDGSS